MILARPRSCCARRRRGRCEPAGRGDALARRRVNAALPLAALSLAPLAWMLSVSPCRAAGRAVPPPLRLRRPPGQLPRTVRAHRHGAPFRQQPAAGGVDHRPVAAGEHDGRLRPLRFLTASGCSSPAAALVVPAHCSRCHVPADEAAGPGGLLGRDPAGDGERVRDFRCASTRARSRQLIEAARIDSRRAADLLRIVLPLLRRCWPRWRCSPSWPRNVSCGR